MITETQLRKILKVEESVWLCQDCFFNAGIYIHKDLLPHNFNPANKYNYQLLGFKGTIVEEEPDIASILDRLNGFDDLVEYQATNWLYEKDDYRNGKKRKQILRKYEAQDTLFEYILIENIYYENLPLSTLFANSAGVTKFPIHNEDKTILTMPVIIEDY